MKKPDGVSSTKFGRKIGRELIKKELLRIVREEENGNEVITPAENTALA